MIYRIRNNARIWMDRNPSIQKAESFLNGRWFLAALAVFIFAVQALGWDLLGFLVCVAVFIYICLFCKHTNATVPVLCLVTFCVSARNSPTQRASGFYLLGKREYLVGEASDFYLSPLFSVTAVVLAVMVVAAILYRLVVFGDFRRAFSLKGLLVGVCLLSIGFVLGGLGVDPEERAWGFGLIQGATFFFVYLFYASTLDYDTFSLSYIADVMLTVLFYILALVTYIYATRFYAFLSLCSDWKAYLYCGWGMCLDFGAYLTVTLPACFYKLLTDKKGGIAWLVVAMAAVVGIFFTMSRGSLVIAGIVFFLGVAVSLRERPLRIPVICTLLVTVLAVMGLSVALSVTAKGENLFSYYEHYLNAFSEGKDISSGRLDIWSRFVSYFQENPVWGCGFGADVSVQSVTDRNPHNGIFDIYSYLAHNLVLQSLGSCGIVGTAGLLVHLTGALWMLVKRADRARTFLLLAVLGFLGVSMLDTVFFKAQFTFLYLAMLAAAEADVFRKKGGAYIGKYDRNTSNKRAGR